jgi:hypothetical protein
VARISVSSNHQKLNLQNDKSCGGPTPAQDECCPTEVAAREYAFASGMKQAYANKEEDPLRQ